MRNGTATRIHDLQRPNHLRDCSKFTEHRCHRLLGGMLVALVMWLSAPQEALAVETLANPDWDITVSEFGYSDLLIYNSGPFPMGFLHEMLSGEWAAAIGAAYRSRAGKGAARSLGGRHPSCGEPPICAR